MAYPIPAYHFIVEWGGSRNSFTEVSGLSIQTEVIEYREGAEPDARVMKMPGLTKFPNVILKRGIIAGDAELFQWMQTQQGSNVQRRDVTISLLNEKHEPVISWKLRNAFPVKVEVCTLKADANEIAVECMELAHEGLFTNV